MIPPGGDLVGPPSHSPNGGLAFAGARDEAKAAFRAAWGESAPGASESTKPTNACRDRRASRYSKREGGTRCPYGRDPNVYAARTRFTQPPRAREMTKAAQRAVVERPVLLREGSRAQAPREIR
jgi:hypothetical protein